MSEWLHPAWPYLAGASLVALPPAPLRNALRLVVPAAAVALAWSLPNGAEASGTLMGLDLAWLRVDPLGRVFAIVFALIGGLGALYGLGTPSRRLHPAAFAATGAGLGIVLAGDWVTLYVAWELLAVTSFVLITDGASARASAASLRYLLVHVSGGALLLAGIVWHLGAGGSARVGALPLAGPAVLILLGFAVNAAIPPLHAWLTDAYPESSPAGTVFLSAFATKAAVYALVRVFPGEEALVWAGTAMTLYGVVFAVMENDIRRLLGYHIVSQVGYMVTGAGLGTPLALSGAVAHAFSHILYKGLLLMGAGSVVHTTGRRKLTELGGLGRVIPATLVLYMIGAFSISGAPLLNGFVSKSLVVAAAEAEHRAVVAWLLNLASVGTFLSVGLKLPYFTFFGRPQGLSAKREPWPMLAAMSVTAAVCAVTGTYPALLYRLLPWAVTYEPYTPGHVLESLQLLAGTALGFALLQRRLGGEPTVTLDTDALYRGPARWIAGSVAHAVALGADLMEAGAARLVDLQVADMRRLATGPLAPALLVTVLVVGAVLALLSLGG